MHPLFPYACQKTNGNPWVTGSQQNPGSSRGNGNPGSLQEQNPGSPRGNGNPGSPPPKPGVTEVGKETQGLPKPGVNTRERESGTRML